MKRFIFTRSTFGTKSQCPDRTTPPFLLFFLCLATLGALCSCAPKGADITRFGLADGEICKDLIELPQDLSVYAKRCGENRSLLSSDEQKRHDARFNKRFFAAWDPTLRHPPKNDVFEALTALNPTNGFAENLRPYSADRWQALRSNCAESRYGETPVRPAITTTSAHLRRLPTDSPYFADPNRAGEGFPFDYMQNSVLWAATPVAVVHASRDGAWVYVTTNLVSGWTRATNLAAVDKKFMSAWRSKPLGAIIRDNAALVVAEKRDAVTDEYASIRAHIGAIFPLAQPAPGKKAPQSPHVSVYVPMRGPDGKAVMATALAPLYALRPKPLALTPGNVAMVGQEMIGQPYGWGGLFEQRDCSATMRDLFTPFGLWLPRNSHPQGRTGARLDLAALSPDEKEAAIMRNGVPFFSLIGMKGHIGLYLGTYATDERETPTMFHNVWGLRTISGRGDKKREGRGVIGKAVVTTLRPGAEHPDISTPASILDRIAGIVVLPEDISPKPSSRTER